MQYKMFNFLVTYEFGRWDASHYIYDLSRAFIWTSDNLSKKYRSFIQTELEELITLPTLFAYEKQHKSDAQIGFIKHISVNKSSLKIEYEISPLMPKIPATTLFDLKFKLDIDPAEFNTTHWAIKERDLLGVLSEAGLIQEKKFKEMFVFICYASEDIQNAERLFDFLNKHGIKAWLDKKSILPGQNWENEIQQAIKKSDAIVVCLSSKSIIKEGFVQKELRTAIDIANEKPEGTIFIIPVRLEDCQVPNSLLKYQYVDLFSDDGNERLKNALFERAKSLNNIRIK